eukprot:5730781-Prymnesium_polylepis.1
MRACATWWRMRAAGRVRAARRVDGRAHGWDVGGGGGARDLLRILARRALEGRQRPGALHKGGERRRALLASTRRRARHPT